MVSIGFCGDSNVYGVGVTTQTRFQPVQKDCNVYGANLVLVIEKYSNRQ